MVLCHGNYLNIATYSRRQSPSRLPPLPFSRKRPRCSERLTYRPWKTYKDEKNTETQASFEFVSNSIMPSSSSLSFSPSPRRQHSISEPEMHSVNTPSTEYSVYVWIMMYLYFSIEPFADVAIGTNKRCGRGRHGLPRGGGQQQSRAALAIPSQQEGCLWRTSRNEMGTLSSTGFTKFTSIK